MLSENRRKNIRIEKMNNPGNKRGSNCLKSDENHSLPIAEVNLEDDSSEEESSFSECENDEEDRKIFQDQFIEGEMIWKREDFSLDESWKSEEDHSLSIAEVKLEDDFSKEESSFSKCENDEEDSKMFQDQVIEGEKICKREDFSLDESWKSEEDHSLSIAEVKLEDDSSEEKSSFSECENDEEDSKMFQDQVIEGEKIWNREDFSLDESCVLHCDKMRLNEITFSKFGESLEEINVNKCQRCENSSMNGSNLDCGIGNVISENYKYEMSGGISGLECHIDNSHLKEKDHKGNTEPSKERPEAHIDDECETTFKENLEQIKGVNRKLKNQKCRMGNNTSLGESKLAAQIESKRSTLKKHIDRVQPKLKKHKCHMCEYTTRFKKYLKPHIDGVHLKLKNYKCHMCDFAASRKQTLSVHIKRIHLKLKSHKQVQLELKDHHKCQLCEYTTNDKQSLKRHIDRVHLKLKNHKCHMCKYAAFEKSRLALHIDSVHLNLRNHNCHMCEYSTNFKRGLKTHIDSVHLKLRNHKCHMCKYAAFEKSRLALHIDSVHLNLRNHNCHMCEYSTNFKQGLKTHIDSVHLKLRNHKCHMCEFTTSFKQSLKTHIDRVHLKLKIFKCHICGYATRQKGQLNSHIKRVHLK